MKTALPIIGWCLLGMLVIAAGLLSAGRKELVAYPAADSYSPSGTAALFSLLSARGYRVSIDRSPRPDVGPGDVAVAFTLSSMEPEIEDENASEDQVREQLLNDAKHGATVFWLPLERDFATASQAADNAQTYLRGDDEDRTVSQSEDLSSDTDKTPPIAVLWDRDSYFVAARKTGLGRNIEYADGIGLTNRFLDKAENAQVFMEILRSVAGPHARIVFTEASFGNVRDPGLLATIGPWAEAAWFQLVFLFLVIVYSLNRRFGLPEVYRPTQKGARELLDAVTDTYARAKAGSAALQAASAEADHRLRSALKLPRDAGPGELYRLLPEPVVDALTKVRAAAEMHTKPKEAHGLIVRLETELDAFLGTRHLDPPGRRLGRRWAVGANRLS